MACLCTSAAVIYLLPYSTEVYYKPLQDALGISNAEIGWLMSTLGIVNMLGYFPGGWLADRFSPRRLLTVSLITTGALGFYFSTFPSYAMCVVVYAGWSLSSIFTFWAALIRATRDWGGESEQGWAFGILEGGRGVIRLGLASLGVVVLGLFADEVAGFSAVVLTYSALDIALGVAVWFALAAEPAADEADSETETDSGSAASPVVEADSEEVEPAGPVPDNRVLAVLRMPVTWLIATVIFASYATYLGSFYFTPYATDAFGLGVVTAGYLASGKMIARPLSAAGAGFLADRFRASTVITVGAAIGVVSFVLFLLTPSQSPLLRLDEVRRPEALLASLRAPRDPASLTLREGFSDELRESVDESAGATDDAVLAAVLTAINDRLEGEALYEDGAFPGAGDRVGALLEDGELSAEARLRANRAVLEEAYPDVFASIDDEGLSHGPPVYMLVFLVLNVLIATLCLYALRGLIYALLQEGGVPVNLTGTATGIVSVLGYTPDIFFPPLVGYFLDRYPGGEGYRYVYGIVAAALIIGLLASLAIARRGRRASAARGAGASDEASAQ
jgi:sugar phosphate permease